jgi:hypothetical protein
MRVGYGRKYKPGFPCRNEDESCDVCHRRALYRSKSTAGAKVMACAEHRSIVIAAMNRRVFGWDSRYHAAVAAKKANRRDSH